MSVFDWLLTRGVVDLKRSVCSSREHTYHINKMFKYMYSEIDAFIETLKTQEPKKEDANATELKYYRLCEVRNNLCLRLKVFEQSLRYIPLENIRDLKEYIKKGD